MTGTAYDGLPETGFEGLRGRCIARVPYGTLPEAECHALPSGLIAGLEADAPHALRPNLSSVLAGLLGTFEHGESYQD